ncbi:hypothetical protein ACFFP0_31630 [Rhizobium puerariae]|uniref:Uncharacterized protein n=1 Tax=Rhizobium puerariae TaxID=1585791 RepID=A0ABV6ASA8_9HYPH
MPPQSKTVLAIEFTMHLPLVSPKVIAVHPAKDENGGPLAWVALETSVQGGGTVAIDLLVSGEVSQVEAAIERAKAGVLIAVVMPMTDVNPYTGRPWHRGAIGPASELDLPPMARMPDDEEDEMQTVIIGDSGEAAHIVVPGRVFEVQNQITAARAVRQNLAVWHDRPIGITHEATGRPILMGWLQRLGMRGAVS